MRIVSHTCSNTEIVCALGCADDLVGVDQDSDFPPEVVDQLPKLGRDLSLDIDGVKSLEPDLVLSSRTLPGHDQIVQQLEAEGLPVLVCEPLTLEDVYQDIRRIAKALDRVDRGESLVRQMESEMPVVERGERPAILIEWWPKPVIAPTQDSWASDLIERAGGRNPWRTLPGKSAPLENAQVLESAPDIVVMAWCGVPLENYRSEVVRRRDGWDSVPAVRHDRIHAISEAFLGRPGPRLVEGYRALRQLIEDSSEASQWR